MARDILVRPVRSGPRSYRIAVGAGRFRTLPELIARLRRSGPVFICTDSTVRRLYGLSLQSALSRAGTGSTLISFPAGEKSKNSTVMEGIYSAMLARGVTRSKIAVYSAAALRPTWLQS